MKRAVKWLRPEPGAYEPVRLSKCGRFRVRTMRMASGRNGYFNYRQYAVERVADGKRLATEDHLRDALDACEYTNDPAWEPGIPDPKLAPLGAEPRLKRTTLMTSSLDYVFAALADSVAELKARIAKLGTLFPRTFADAYALDTDVNELVDVIGRYQQLLGISPWACVPTDLGINSRLGFKLTLPTGKVVDGSIRITFPLPVDGSDHFAVKSLLDLDPDTLFELQSFGDSPEGKRGFARIIAACAGWLDAFQMAKTQKMML